MTLQSIIAKANTAVPEVVFNVEGNGMEHRKGDSTFEITSSIRGPTLDSVDSLKLLKSNLPAQPYEIDAETKELMTAIGPDGMLVNPQYFAQTANRRGFVYHYINSKGHNDSIKFESGVYVTHDPWLVEKLNFDISRQMGLSAHIANISASTYNDIVVQARSYRAMAAGMSNSSQGSAHKMAAEAEKEAMKALLEDQKRQIAELTNIVTGNTSRTATAASQVAKVFERTDEDRANIATRVADNNAAKEMFTNLLSGNTGISGGGGSATPAHAS
jgi:hypothetical protein